MKTFRGYNIYRKKNIIKFGCGEVKVTTKDLKTLAEKIQDPIFRKKLESFIDYRGIVLSSYSIGKLTKKDLEKINQYQQNLHKFKDEDDLFIEQIMKKTNRYISARQLLRIKPKTFLSLKG